MEPVRPPSGPVAPQAVAQVTPLGRGWMLVTLDAGFALRNAAEGVDLRLRPEEAEGLRRGTVTPEALVVQGAASPLPMPPQVAVAGQVTVRFSPEALRLSGQTGPGAGRQGRPAPPVSPIRTRTVWIGAGCLALLVLVLIGT